MDGDIAPLRTSPGALRFGVHEAKKESSGEICDLADKYEAQVFVDECHATGFLGQSLEIVLK